MSQRTLKTSLDAMDAIKGLLILSGIDNVLSGGIYIATRPLGSNKEDCVLNTTYFDADQLQTGIINVNFHVPNLPHEPSDNPTATDGSQPNKARLNQLGALASVALDNVNAYDFSVRMRSPGRIEGHNQDWYYNLIIEYNYMRQDNP